MPIKPENRARYPKDWAEIRTRILKRAGYRCEHEDCKARQYSVGFWQRSENGLFTWLGVWGQNDNHRTYAQAREMAAVVDWEQGEEGQKPIVIVLTIAHLDHQPENSQDHNLRALCQRHHLAHDLLHHRTNAQSTRKARMAVGDLFDQVVAP